MEDDIVVEASVKVSQIVLYGREREEEREGRGGEGRGEKGRGGEGREGKRRGGERRGREKGEKERRERGRKRRNKGYYICSSKYNIISSL